MLGSIDSSLVKRKDKVVTVAGTGPVLNQTKPNQAGWSATSGNETGNIVQLYSIAMDAETLCRSAHK